MKNILIVKFGALGDVIRTSYILPGLYQKYTDAKVYWYTSPASVDLLRFNPFVTEIITDTQGHESIRNIVFDLVISLDDEIEILNRLSEVKSKEYIGAFLENGHPTYTDSASEWFDMGLISRFGKVKADELKRINKREHNQILATMLGIEINQPIFFNSSIIEDRVRMTFDANYFNIGLNSGAGSRWISKQLPMNETVALVRSLIVAKICNKDVRVFLLGGKEEEERHKYLLETVKSDRLVNTGNNNSLLDFAAIIKCCDLVITSDSLALHLAISQGVRNISFYAPTSANEIGVFGTGEKVVSTSGDYCSYRRDADNSTIKSELIFQLAVRSEHAFVRQ